MASSNALQRLGGKSSESTGETDWATLRSISSPSSRERRRVGDALISRWMGERSAGHHLILKVVVDNEPAKRCIDTLR